MAKIVSRYSVPVSAIPEDEGILNVVRVKDNEVQLHWEGYVGPPGVFIITRRESSSVGPYEVRGTTREYQFTDTVDAVTWYKYRLEFVAD